MLINRFREAGWIPIMCPGEGDNTLFMVWIRWCCQLVSIATSGTTFLSSIQKHILLRCLPTTSLQCVQLHWTFGDTKLAQEPATMSFVFVYERVRVSYLKSSEGICDANRFLLFCLIPPLAHVFYHSRQERLGSERWEWNVFWSRFSDPGTLRGPARADVEWLMNTEAGRLRRDKTAGRS